MTEGGRFDRRSLLVGGIKAGLGLGLGARSARGLISSRHRLADEASGAAPSVVGTEPLRPPNFSRYVTRPDLTPVGVSISATPQLLALGRNARLYLLRPQEPAGGQPGTRAGAPVPAGGDTGADDPGDVR